MKILDRLNIQTDNIKLYEQALTHTSYANEHGCESYERLEYLGDAVLELVMSEYLFKNMEGHEGELTKYRAHYVCEDALYEYSISLELNDDLRLGNGETLSGGKFKKAIVADIYEAFIGALFLDKGFERAKEFIYESAIPFVQNNSFEFIHNYKSELQELVQTDKRSLNYEIIKEEGPAHDRTYTAIVKIDDIKYGEGTAHSKKDAEQMAAKDALNKSVK
jgi:ribonuclease-3